MNNGASGIVKRSHFKEDAALGPNPMANGRVHKSRPQQHKDQHGRKLHAAGKRADHERRRQHGKRHLEDDEKIRGNTARRRLDVNAPQKRVIQAAYESVTRGKCERIAHDKPQQSESTTNYSCLRQHGEHVFLSAHSAVKKLDSRNCHEKHQRRCH